MRVRSYFRIEDNRPGFPLVIRDLGGELGCMSVTNDAESVVEYLYSEGDLTDDRKLYYYDTEGDLDEIVHEKGQFVRFNIIRDDSSCEFCERNKK
jgi:hypothetical protein